MNSIIETITPAMAGEYLKLSGGNRAISTSTVSAYANAMKAGLWMINGQAIIFDLNGRLIDGHHRLNAIISANVPITTQVVRGVAPEAMSTIDNGKTRSFGDVLSFRGVENYVQTAAVVDAANTLIIYGRFWANNGASRRGGKKLNIDKVYLYLADSEGYCEAARFGREKNKKLPIIKASWIGGMYYHLINTGGYERSVVEFFFDSICSMDEPLISPLRILRQKLIQDKMSNRHFESETVCALLFKSWTAYIKKKDIHSLTWNKGKEEFPWLILNSYGKQGK